MYKKTYAFINLVHGYGLFLHLIYLNILFSSHGVPKTRRGRVGLRVKEKRAEKKEIPRKRERVGLT